MLLEYFGDGHDRNDMIDLSLTITMVDQEPATFRVTPKVQVEFERHFKVAIAGAFVNDPHVEHLYWLGHASMRSAGMVVKPFDGWLDGLESVKPEVGNPLAGPS